MEEDSDIPLIEPLFEDSVLASPSTYFFIGVFFLVLPVLLIVGFGKTQQAKQVLAKMFGREGAEKKKARYEMVNQRHDV